MRPGASAEIPDAVSAGGVAVRLDTLDFRLVDLIPVPVIVFDAAGRCVHANPAASAATGYADADLRGRQYRELVSLEWRKTAEAEFARTIENAQPADFELAFADAQGRLIPARARLVPLVHPDAVVGVVMVAYAARADELEQIQRVASPTLTSRQFQVLTLLAQGHTTREIAERLGLASETVRNHIRAILRALGAHSRLEAVVAAEHLGLLPPVPLHAPVGR